jgi:tetratricopeptide (TPR) repeat protein
MLEYGDAVQRAEFGEVDMEYARTKVANSPAGMAWRCSYAWMLAERGAAAAAREQLDLVAADGFAGLHFDTNWPTSMGELTGACLALGEREIAAGIYDRLAPYAGRPLTAGRAVGSFGVADRLLGDLAALLGRREVAIDHYEAAVRLNRAMGNACWAVHAQLGLAAALEDERMHDAALVDAAALGLTGLLG